MILGLRPVLIHQLKYSTNPDNELSDETASTLTTLSEACIHAARYSLKLCVDEWTSGTLAVFGYAFPAFIFSSSLVLVASSVSWRDNSGDDASVEIATEMLKTLSNSNSLPAKDFYEQLERVRDYIRRHQDHLSGSEKRTHALGPQHSSDPISDPISIAAEQHEESTFPQFTYGASSPRYSWEGIADDNYTTEMALQSALMQEFLTQTQVEVQSLNHMEMLNDFDTVFF